MCEYLIVIVTFCHQAFQFVTQSRLKLIASALMLSFDQQFKDFEIGLERWATLMNGMVTELTTQIHVDNERALSTQSNRLASLMRINRERQFEERRLRLLKRLSPSQDEFGFIWRREQKKGSVDWAFQQDEYLAWKKSDTSATLVIVGTLGSGKTVVMANLVKDLYKSSDTESSQTSHTVVASFFCQHQTKKTLVAEVIIGSLVHQIVRSLGPDDIDLLPLSNISTTSDEMPIDFHAILSRIRQSRRQKDRRYFVAIDALDECPAEESSMVIKELVRMTKHLPLSIVLSARSESVLLDRLSRLPPVSRLSMANSTKDFEIAQYIDREIAVRVGDGKLNADIVNKIKFVLTSAAQGMYLWVALQLETIMPQHGGLVSQDNILSMLENLPRNLHEAYARGLARINDKRYGSRIFMLVAGAARPLKIKELRVALNITPCETFWSPSSMVLDPSSLVWSCGGGLLEIDESNDAVYWIHHRAMRCLLHQNLGNDPPEIPKVLRGFQFQLSDAERELGRICVTFLSFDVHDRRVQVRRPMLRSDLAVKVINDSIPTDSWIAKFRRPQASKQGGCVPLAIDISRVAETLGGIQIEDQESFNDFLAYSQEYWIQHSRDFWNYPPQSEIDRICEGCFAGCSTPK